MARFRIGSYNVENLFERAQVFNNDTWAEGRPALNAFEAVNQLLQRESYAGRQQRILKLLDDLGILTDDEGEYVRLRKIRGQLLRRPRSGDIELVAAGRGDWIGWVELKTEPVNELAMQHTAEVIRDVDADLLGVVEAENRPLLETFTTEMLKKVNGRPYAHVMLIEGRDKRGIDVGLLSRAPIQKIRSHFSDEGADDIFSRDCSEYHVTLGTTPIVLLVNHFKSKGYSEPKDPLGEKRRTRQAKRVRVIVNALISSGHRYVAVIGDLNDTPDSTSLSSLLRGSTLRDVSEHPDFQWNGRRGTFETSNTKLDYVLCSPALFGRLRGGEIVRTGVWHGPRVANPWPMYPTLTEERLAASDHAAIVGEFDFR